MTADKTITIAVDGPAASGKGTLSRRLSSYYGLAYLDTGTLYRGVGWLMLKGNLDPRDEEAAAEVSRAFSVDQIEGADIRSPDVSRASSIVAAQAAVRAALLDFQRQFTMTPPNNAKGAVLDGRDIGTVVCPDALVKLYVSASAEERARRRWLELEKSDNAMSYETVLDDIKRRDARDSGREAAPMRPASDAHFIDTTEMDADAVFARACRHIDQALGERA